MKPASGWNGSRLPASLAGEHLNRLASESGQLLRIVTKSLVTAKADQQCRKAEKKIATESLTKEIDRQ